MRPLVKSGTVPDIVRVGRQTDSLLSPFKNCCPVSAFAAVALLEPAGGCDDALHSPLVLCLPFHASEDATQHTR